MLIMYLGIYTLILALLWGLFIVAKIHAYKFKNFSYNITKVTNVLLIFLISLSLIGYLLIFFTTGNSTTIVKDYGSFDAEEVNY